MRTIKRTKSGAVRFLIVLAALMFAVDSVPPISHEEIENTAQASSTTLSSSHGYTDSDSTDNHCPASSEGHCHHHHCQSTLASTLTMAPPPSSLDNNSEKMRIPSTPFLERVPRPPSA